MQVGRTKDQGLYNKPSAVVHPGGISRRDPTTIQYNVLLYSLIIIFPSSCVSYGNNQMKTFE